MITIDKHTTAFSLHQSIGFVNKSTIYSDLTTPELQDILVFTLGRVVELEQQLSVSRDFQAGMMATMDAHLDRIKQLTEVVDKMSVKIYEPLDSYAVKGKI